MILYPVRSTVSINPQRGLCDDIETQNDITRANAGREGMLLVESVLFYDEQLALTSSNNGKMSITGCCSTTGPCSNDTSFLKTNDLVFLKLMLTWNKYILSMVFR